MRGLKGVEQPTQIGTFSILMRLNYQVWAFKMCLHLEGLELWEVIETETLVKKKDRQVISILFSTLSDEISQELDVEKTTKQMWNLLKAKNGGVSHLRMAHIQSLQKDYKNLFIEDDELILDYFEKLSQIVIELKIFKEKVSNADLSTKLLRLVSGKFDSITMSIE